MKLELQDLAAHMRREFVVVCDRSGTVTERCSAARTLLRVEPGSNLPSIANEGGEPKLRAVISKGTDEPKELALVVDGRPVVTVLRGEILDASRTIIVGSVLPQDFEDTMRRVREVMTELSELHRTSERQRHELVEQNEKLVTLNRELDDSTRGMIALHDEVDEKSDSLRRMGEVKARMISNVSHEFRTPLNSILGLARMLLSGSDGELNEEQKKQLGYIRRSAESLTELVNNILDLSKIEAGKVSLRPQHFSVQDLFSALRGMLRPLASADDVELIFEDPLPSVPELDTDENKVSQVLKNLISNALKFTEKGHVRVSAEAIGNNRVVFRVADTGIGIEPQHLDMIFEEFSQVENPIQRRVKGTGLGLSLSRRTAAILGGSVTVQSTPGEGSVFSFEIPKVHPEVEEMARLQETAKELDPARAPILVVEDDRQTLFLYERYLRGSGFQVLPARSSKEARLLLQRARPAAIVLDVMLDGESSWSFLQELKSTPETRDIPVLVVTVTNRERQARAMGADGFFVKPVDREWLLRRLNAVAQSRGPVEKILVIDDDEVSRYLIHKMLADTRYRVFEAATAEEGIRLARTENPHIIILDFVLVGATALDVLDDLKADPRTRRIPVIVQTSKRLTDEERKLLGRETTSVISKQNLSREVAIARIREALHSAGLHRASSDS